MHRPRILIISPAAASANNGNWQTAWRWSRMLRSAFEVKIAQSWNGDPFDVMLALHARRSADSIARWAQAQGAHANAVGLGLVLTGTDLYRDIQVDGSAKDSLGRAQRLVVLQECGLDALPADLLYKARVIFQSTASRAAVVKTARHQRVVTVGHLRQEKSPQTLFATASRLQSHADIFFDHIGGPLEPELAQQAQSCAAQHPQYRWLGELSHETTLRHIQRAHVLLHTSRMEGGAHAIMEAVCSGTPVLASNIAGNVGMLGADYSGYFDHDDTRGLTDLLVRCRADQHHNTGFYSQLKAQCDLRAPLFAPATEQSALMALVQDLLN